MKLTKRTALATVFIISTIISSVFLVSGTFNYTEFYRALEIFSLQLQNVSLSINEEKINISITFTMQNPTSYVGLKLREISFSLRLTAKNESAEIFSDTISYAARPIDIEPYWNRTITYGDRLDSLETLRFLEISKSHMGEEATWVLAMTTILITFSGTMNMPLNSTLTSRL